jgi:hypothetical protein
MFNCRIYRLFFRNCLLNDGAAESAARQGAKQLVQFPNGMSHHVFVGLERATPFQPCGTRIEAENLEANVFNHSG